jgi:hypothetical protein
MMQSLLAKSRFLTVIVGKLLTTLLLQSAIYPKVNPNFRLVGYGCLVFGPSPLPFPEREMGSAYLIIPRYESP